MDSPGDSGRLAASAWTVDDGVLAVLSPLGVGGETVATVSDLVADKIAGGSTMPLADSPAFVATVHDALAMVLSRDAEEAEEADRGDRGSESQQKSRPPDCIDPDAPSLLEALPVEILCYLVLFMGRTDARALACTSRFMASAVGGEIVAVSDAAGQRIDPAFLAAMGPNPHVRELIVSRGRAIDDAALSLMAAAMPALERLDLKEVGSVWILRSFEPVDCCRRTHVFVVALSYPPPN